MVRALEAGGLGLDESVALWERGEALARRCEEQLAGTSPQLGGEDGTIIGQSPALLDAFRTAFGGRTDVGLVLKVNSPDAGDYDFALLKERARGLNVFWMEERLSQAATFDLMASLDAYVSLHRAEGFGLTMAEAMAMAKPVIATGYSGNLDFMDGESALLVDCDVVTTREAHGAYPAGSRWARPSVAHCADQMLSLEDGSVRQRVGEAGSRKLRSSLDPAAAGRRIDALCRRILAAK